MSRLTCSGCLVSPSSSPTLKAFTKPNTSKFKCLGLFHLVKDRKPVESNRLPLLLIPWSVDSALLWETVKLPSKLPSSFRKKGRFLPESSRHFTHTPFRSSNPADLICTGCPGSDETVAPFFWGQRKVVRWQPFPKTPLQLLKAFPG